MVRAGLAKLNMPATSSTKQIASSGIKTAQRAAAASYGILAQRTNQSIFNAKAYYSNNMAALRHQLNSRTVINNNFPDIPTPSNKMSTMDKIMMWSSIGMMGAQMAAGLAQAFKSDGKGSSEVNIKTETPKTTLSDFNKTLQETNKKVGNFSSDYNKLKLDGSAQSNLANSITAAKDDDDLKQYVNQLDPSQLNITELNLTDSSGIEDIQNAIESTTTDYNNVSAFSSALKQSIQSIGTGITSLEGQIQQAEASEPQGDVSALKDKLDKLKQLKSDLEAQQSAVDKLATDLQPKSSELTKLKQEKANAMDKVYDQALADDKTIGENNKKMQSLEAKIKGAKGDKKDKLIAEYNTLADSNKTLQTAITSSGGAQIKKGDETTSITMTNWGNAKIAHYVDNSRPDVSNTPQTQAEGVSRPNSNAGTNINPVFQQMAQIFNDNNTKLAPYNDGQLHTVNGVHFKIAVVNGLKVLQYANGTPLSAEDQAKVLNSES